jgi:hypothetical protein
MPFMTARRVRRAWRSRSFAGRTTGQARRHDQCRREARGTLHGYCAVMAVKRPATPFRVYVGGLGVSTTESALFAAFARIGVQLGHVELVVNRATGCRRGFAFVALEELPTGTNADAVLARMRLAVVDDRSVTVQRIPSELTSSPPIQGPELGRTPRHVWIDGTK